MKNLVICCDGTANEWTTPDKTSNVVQLFCMLFKDLKSQQQVAYYDPGVGTRGFVQWLDWWDQATGWSIDENVKQAYEFLMNFYENGDKIFLFGFSRGAFTVRVLSGLIFKSGLLHKRNENLIEYAFKIFKETNNEDKAEDFRNNLSQNVNVDFIGVWDTVSAMLHKFTLRKLPYFFEDSMISSNVKFACQALAIDDFRRAIFRPILWGPIESGERMEQVWFVGAHSDIGGGYPEDSNSRRLARIPLQWIIKKAIKKGLLLNPSIEPEDIAKSDDFLGDIHRPDKSFPWYLGFLTNGPRPIPTELISRGTSDITYPKFHISFWQRMETRNDYNPKNLPPCFEIVDDEGRVCKTIQRESIIKTSAFFNLLAANTR